MTHTTRHEADHRPWAPSPSPVRNGATNVPSRSAEYVTADGLEWLGPLAFGRRHAGGVDHDFGDHWGRSGEQRLTVRHPLGTEHGLFYVYDAIWDEFAVLAQDVPLQAVHDATARLAAYDPHTSAGDVVAAVLAELAAPEPRPGTTGPAARVEL